MLTSRRLLKKAGLLLASLGLLLAFPILVFAAAAVTQSVTQGYGSDTTLQQGMIVKLEDKDASKVEPLALATITKMQGVVVAPSDAAVTLSNTNSNGQVYVATSGEFDVLVSNQAGTIKNGDYITISSLAGVGMKADSTESIVLGRATAGFDGISNVQSSASLTNTKGQKVSVSIGRIPVNIGIASNPLQQSLNNNLPGFLKKASQQVANKPVSTVRVYISLAILISSAIVAGSMLYGGVRSSITSIGRNPLAKRSIVRSLVQVVLTSIIIFVIGLLAVYLLLKL